MPRATDQQDARIPPDGDDDVDDDDDELDGIVRLFPSFPNFSLFFFLPAYKRQGGFRRRPTTAITERGSC